jgi:hypothetical protein
MSLISIYISVLQIGFLIYYKTTVVKGHRLGAGDLKVRLVSE